MSVSKSNILFVYIWPHPSHKGFAEAIGADFQHVYFGRELYPPITKRILLSFACGIRYPNYQIYLCEGGLPLVPVAIKKLSEFNRIKVIELIADETFMMMKETPNEMKDRFKWYHNIAHKIASKFIDGAIAVSKLAKEMAEEFLDVPIRVAYPYIEDEMYEKLGKINPNIESYKILSVGYAAPKKGMDILVEAFKMVKKEIKDVELYIIGKNHPKEWNKIEGVHVEGYVDDLVPYFEDASLFVQASRADTFPVTTLEALRAGLPVIVTEMTGTKEVVEKLGKEFVRKVDAEDIAKGILHYFDLSDSMKVKLSLMAKELSEKFNRKRMCEMFRKEFNLLLEEI